VTDVRPNGAGRAFATPVDIVLLVALALLCCVPSSLGGAPASVSISPAGAPTAGADANLTVDPPSFWLRSGDNVTLRAVWSLASPLCEESPLWFRWTVELGPATGLLNATNGSSATFRADSFDSGTVTVEVRSEAVLECGANQSVLDRTGTTNLSVVVPLALSGMGVVPLLPAPGSNATLSGNISGGAPPYAVHVTWGDGTYASVELDRPGSFSANHSFPAGQFVPFATVSDSDGDLENASVPQAVSVGTGFRVAIAARGDVAETGTPVIFTPVVADAPAGSVPLMGCSNATTQPTAGSGIATPFTCTFSTPGGAEVVFGVFAPELGGPSASAVLRESVVPPPRLRVMAFSSLSEVNETALVDINLSGGFPPISLTWNLSGNRIGTSICVSADGEGVLAISASRAGAYTLSVRALDLVGGLGVNATGEIEIDAPLRLQTSGERVVLPFGARVGVDTTIFVGCPPFSWWVIPAALPSNGSFGQGVLEGTGSFAWNASIALEGNLSIAVIAVDSCGSFWQSTLRVPLVPALWATASVIANSSEVNESVELSVSIQGGLPPFLISLTSGWNRSQAEDGTSAWTIPVSGNGSDGLLVTVLDRCGVMVGIQLNVSLEGASPPASPPPTDSPPASLNSSSPSLLDVLGLTASLFVPIGGGALAGLLWRRHGRRVRNSRNGPPPDPEKTLRNIIEPAEGAERFTVELLAEEKGVALPIVRSTIDRLVTEGRVRSETGADGEEVLTWCDTGH